MKIKLLSVLAGLALLAVLEAPHSQAASPVSLWSTSARPATVDSNDPGAVELGLKFSADVAGSVNGLRFYKAVANTGTHVGNLWSLTGANLATVIFSGESNSGWQSANFASPVSLTSNVLYVVSYHTNSGHYSDNSGYFSTNGRDASPLHAPSDNTPGGNGVYKYGTGGFPDQHFQATNYWVDVLFTPGTVPSPTPTATPTATPIPTAMPTPTPTPTPTPPPSGFPDATNTGVPAGTVLTSVGNMTVTTDGAVLDSLSIGCLNINANNVTVKRSLIRSGSCGNGGGLTGVGDAFVNGRYIDVEIDGLNADAGNSGIRGGGGFTCLRCNIHGVGNGFNIWSQHPSTIQDSYVHDLYIRDDLGTHNQDVYMNATNAGITIRHNNLENWDGQTAATLIDASWGGPISHITEDGNLFNGGGYEVYGGAPNQVSQIVITNNHFGRKFFSNGGFWGPTAYIACGGPGNVFSGNVWDDTGLPVIAC